MCAVTQFPCQTMHTYLLHTHTVTLTQTQGGCNASEDQCTNLKYSTEPSVLMYSGVEARVSHLRFQFKSSWISRTDTSCGKVPYPLAISTRSYGMPLSKDIYNQQVEREEVKQLKGRECIKWFLQSGDIHCSRVYTQMYLRTYMHMHVMITKLHGQHNRFSNGQIQY